LQFRILPFFFYKKSIGITADCWLCWRAYDWMACLREPCKSYFCFRMGCIYRQEPTERKSWCALFKGASSFTVLRFRPNNESVTSPYKNSDDIDLNFLI